MAAVGALFGLSAATAAAQPEQTEVREAAEQPAPGEADVGAEPPAPGEADVGAEPPDTAGDAEVLFDPELDAEGRQGGEAETRSEAAARSGGAEILSDPELDDVGGGSLGAPVPTSRTELRSFLASRVGVDLAWTVPTEEVVESTQVAQVELVHHPSDTVGVALGLRMRHVAAFREDTDAPGGQSRLGLDVAPVAGYADVLVTDGVHARAGYQIIQLGRFDAFGATNFLAVYDLRSGPATIPEANHVAQPALRLDFDPDESVTLTGIYVPFFTPHLFDPVGTDYSLPVGDPVPLDGVAVDPMFAADAAALERALGRAIDRSTGVGLSSGAMRAFAPDPDFLEPQGALRATLRGVAGELSATLGTGLERLPSLRVSEAFLADLESIANGATPPSFAELVDPPPVTVEHGRVYLASVDGATDVGPVQVGAEVTYMIDRTLTAVPDGPCTTFERRCVGNPERSDVAQLALRGELLEGEGFVVVVEAFGARALEDPSIEGQRWTVVDESGFLYGVGGGLRWAPGRTGLELELGGAALNGPTVLVVPRAEYELSQGLFVELGAVVVEGRSRPPELLDQSLGYAYDNVDQVFTGLRWVP